MMFSGNSKPMGLQEFIKRIIISRLLPNLESLGHNVVCITSV